MHAKRTPLKTGEESVWDYPRPPRLDPSRKHVQVVFAGTVVADSRRAVRVLETSHPPVFYLPPEDVRTDLLTHTPRSSVCKFKGRAIYRTLRLNAREAVDGERVRAQGGFYGGWVTDEIEGPLEGNVGTWGW